MESFHCQSARTSLGSQSVIHISSAIALLRARSCLDYSTRAAVTAATPSSQSDTRRDESLSWRGARSPSHPRPIIHAWQPADIVKSPSAIDHEGGRNGRSRSNSPHHLCGSAHRDRNHKLQSSSSALFKAHSFYHRHFWFSFWCWL